MPDTDPWVEAAKNFKPSADGGAAPASGGNDDWKVWQQQGDDSGAQGDGTGALNGLKQGAGDLISGITSLPHALRHPIDTLDQMGQQQEGLASRAKQDFKSGNYGNAVWHGIDAALPVLGPMDAALTDQYQGGDKSGAMTRGAVDALPYALDATVGRAGPALRGGASMVDNAVLGTKASALERGANPGAALSENRIWGTTPAKLLGKVDEQIPKATLEHRSAVSRFTRPGSVINTGPLVSEPFNAGVAEATDPLTGAASPSQIAKTLRTQRSLTHALDPQSGAITTDMRNPNLTPLQATQLKSKIYGLTDYDNPSRAAISNQSLKGAAHNLKGAVEQAVPESKPSGQNLHNLMSAKESLRGPAEGTKFISADKSGIINRALTGVGTGGAALMDATGAASPTLARILQAPLLAQGAAATTSDAYGSRKGR